VRTNIVLNDDLVREATMLTGITTKRELVEVALRELIHSKKKKNLFDLVGQIDFDDNYDYKSTRALRGVAEKQADYDPD